MSLLRDQRSLIAFDPSTWPQRPQRPMLKAMTDAHNDREAASRAAREELKKLQDRDTVFGGTLGSTVERAKTHFGGNDNAADDKIEIWGKRIGRILSLIGVVALGLYLYATYFR